jgi:hypothetical protein
VSKQRETEWQRRQRRERERAEHVAEHGPACQLCGNVPRRGLDQDHDHKTGLTRGWLCHRCNRALPTWVTPEWLILAALYLAWGADEAAAMRQSVEAQRAGAERWS